MGQVSPAGGSNPQKEPRVVPFGKYLLLDRIAVGGMAELYTTKSFGIEGFEKIIAIKRILPTMAEDDDFITMFIDEAKIAGHLTHANIVPIYELGKIGESHYIAMEYVWGKDLLQIMNRFRRMRRHMPPVMAAWIVSKMLEGLDYAHRKRDRHGRPMSIIHRDVSPQNILVSYEGQIKLIDFGIAKAASRNTKTQAGVLKGKFGYMSPEQVRGLPIDHRSDVFAASTCLHEMLTGERLFVGESDFSTLEKVRNATVKPPSQMVAELPPDLEAIVLKGLAREAEDRWQTAGEMQEELQRFIALQRPPFGTSKLNTWMRTAFAPEIAKEKARLDLFNKISHPGPAAAQPRVPSLGATSPQNPAARRPANPVSLAATPIGTDEIELLDDDPGEFAAEATMITASPFDEMEAQRAEAEALPEEATQIFFSMDDLEEVHPAPAAGAPVGSLSPVPRPIPAATFPRPAAPSPSVQVAPVPPAARMPAPAPMPASAPPLKSTQALDASQLPPPPPGAEPFAQPPPPIQRNLQTIEVRAATAPTAEKKKMGIGLWIAAAAAAALLVIGLSVGGAYLVFAGDETGSIRILVNPSAADARVFVDGIQRGRAPLLLEHVPAGEHEIEIRADGYQDAQRTVPVNGGESMLEIGIEPVVAVAANDPVQPAAPTAPPPTANPEGTAAEGEGASTAEEPPATETPEPAPTETAPTETAPTAEAAPPEGAPARPTPTRTQPAPRATPTRPTPTRPRPTPTSTRSRPTPTSARSQTPTPTRTRPARGQGTLTINTVPWARVFVDGRDTGRNTPVRNLSIRAGHHTIGLRTNDGTMHRVPIDITAGENSRILREL